MMFYSQNYIQGKNGVIMCVDSQELIMEDISQNEMNINDLMHKIGLLKDNAMVPITLFYTKMNPYD
jgi:GTPase SAR1 family protein